MADVFISYAREDRPRAEQIARGLGAIGLDCFWDTEIPPGQTWADYIEGKLNACKVAVVLWSEHSTKSQWVREEARMGRDKGKLVPAMLDASPAPFGFGEVQAANLSNWRGENTHPDWVRFANAVDAAVRGPNATPRPVPSAAPQMFAESGGAAGSAEKLDAFGYIRKCFRLYFNGNGRARRSEYWWWTLFAFGVTMITYIFDGAVYGLDPTTSMPYQQMLSLIAFLVLAAPGTCVTIRRFHDVGLSGWLVLGAFIAYLAGAAISLTQPAIAGLIFVIIMIGALVVTFLPSQAGTNAYGANPKGL